MARPELLLAVLFCTSAFTANAVSQDQGTNPSPLCETSVIAIDIQFEGAAAAGCDVRDERVFNISIRPEDDPINPSPWYAIRITAIEAGPVSISLDYGDFTHRYRPQISTDGENWAYVSDENIVQSEDGLRVSISLVIDEQPIFLSAQELFTAEDYAQWMEDFRGNPDFEVADFGSSREGRPLTLIRSHSDAGNGTIVLVGRQHPPEVTGALAMQAFVREISGNSLLARRFRETYDLLIIPLINPDGVEHGHWRHNLGSTDLNRDWGPFTQPETQAVLSLIDELAESQATRPVVFLDFHSTNRDVFYTQPVGQDGTAYGFTRLWLENAGARLPGYHIERAERHQSDLPTSKNYMFGRFEIPAITYELGDNTDRRLIDETARVFAREMMQILIAQPDLEPSSTE